MPEYVKPNVLLPLSLHDARLNAIKIEADRVVFVIEGGIFKVDGEAAERTGRAAVSFSRVDFDFCSVSCTGGDGRRTQYDIRAFAAELKGGRFAEIIDETYGYNLAKFGCVFAVEDAWLPCDIEIYHFGPMKYAWED